MASKVAEAEAELPEDILVERLRKEQQLSVDALRRAGWERHSDDETGRGYYFHMQSGHSQWGLPALADTHQEDSDE